MNTPTRPGFGMLLAPLLGSGHEVAHAAVGKRISVLRLDDDDDAYALRFTFQDGSAMSVSDWGQSCCEKRYMRTDDALPEFVGAVFLGLEVKDAPAIPDPGGDCHEVQFLEVKTDRGVLTMASHNEHNGNYSGFSLRVVDLPPGDPRR